MEAAMKRTVTLHEATHIYTDDLGRRYQSVGSLVKRFVPPFDPDGTIVERYAAKHGRTVASVAADWKEEGRVANAFGHCVHRAIQMWAQTGIENGQATAEVQSLVKVLPHKWTYFSERILFNENALLAGTADLLDWDAGRRTVDIFDFKTNKKLVKINDWDRYLLPPLDQMPDNNWSHYCLQLNLYRWLLERRGVTVPSMTLLWLNRATSRWEPHLVPRLEPETEMMIATLRKNNA